MCEVPWQLRCSCKLSILGLCVCLSVCTINWNKLIRWVQQQRTTSKAFLGLQQHSDLPALFCIDVIGVAPGQAEQNRN